MTCPPVAAGDPSFVVVACLRDPQLVERVREGLAARGVGVDTVAPDAVVDAVALAIELDIPVALVLDGTTEGWLGMVARLVDRHPTVKPFLVADFDRSDTFISAVSAGVTGFCRADAKGSAIARAIRSMVSDGVAIPRAFVAPLVEEVRRGRGHVVHSASGDVVVTDREWDILQMVVQRRSTREMADALFVSVGTVRSHVSTLLRKLGAIDRDDVVAIVNSGRPEP